MKAEELRIGNLVYKYYPSGIEIEAVNEINSYFVNGIGISAIEPIPLTEEWLLKFGFEKEGGWFKKKRLLLFNIRNMYFTTPSKDIVSVDVTTVHQLQNLYFALTGEELTLKNQSK
jgi:hypothetical protein